jgi:hypothetical protein
MRNRQRSSGQKVQRLSATQQPLAGRHRALDMMGGPHAHVTNVRMWHTRCRSVLLAAPYVLGFLALSLTWGHTFQRSA